MHFPEKDKIFSQLEELFTVPTKVIVGVSGGPDSRFAFALVADFYASKGRDQELLIVAHFNHGQRKESDEEQKQIFKRYENYHIYYNDNKVKKGLNESELRDVRISFFQEICEKEKATYMITGHNLDDRIETSLLNMLRGASLKGMSNMTFCDYRKGIIFVRPLIKLKKTAIQKICDKNKLDYFIDPTNNDSSYTARNKLRNDIIPQIMSLKSQGSTKRYESRIKIYEDIERISYDKNSDYIRIIQLNMHPSWGARFVYKIALGKPNPHTIYTESNRIYIFQKIGIRKNVSQKTLAERVKFSNTSKDGYKYLAGVYFFISHGKIYAIKAAENFRETVSYAEVPVSNSEKTHFDAIDITNKTEWKGGTIRYAREGDSYKGKRLKKRMINQKIPLFRRNFVPVIEKKGKIIDVVKEIIPKFYLQEK